MKEKLRCEICGGEFDSGAPRPFSHCQRCAEKLREQKLGPVQLLGRPDVAELVRSIVRREFRL